MAPGTSSRVLPARGQWQSWLGIPNQFGSPRCLFQVGILDEYNDNLSLFIILKYLLYSQGVFCRTLAWGDPVLEKSWSPCGGHWPLALSCCCRVPTWGHKRKGSCPFRATGSQAKELFFTAPNTPPAVPLRALAPAPQPRGFGKAPGYSAAQVWAGAEARAPLLWPRVKPRL